MEKSIDMDVLIQQQEELIATQEELLSGMNKTLDFMKAEKLRQMKELAVVPKESPAKSSNAQNRPLKRPRKNMSKL